jgi:hypothetical protein
MLTPDGTLGRCIRSHYCDSKHGSATRSGEVLNDAEVQKLWQFYEEISGVRARGDRRVVNCRADH